jgi:hypothetical protein
MEKVRCRIGYDSLFVVDPVGRSGGLALFWKKFVNVEIFNYSRFHIQALVKDDDGNAFWKLTGFYGHPSRDKRRDSWSLLKFLKYCPSLPWCCFGDFNEIVEQREKEGRGPRSETQMASFREALEDCGLSDLDYVGPKFTWSNRQEGDHFIQERLDQALGDREWCRLFPFAKVFVLEAICSDHNPILVIFKEHQGSRLGKKGGGFKFEAAWIRDVEYQNLIQNAWKQDRQEGATIRGIQYRLSSCQRELKRWSGSKSGKLNVLLKKKREQLRDIQQRCNSSSLEEIKALQSEINEILEREDLRWKQRAKQHWYLSGDRNTQFFHAWANQRRKMNAIHSIADAEGWVWRRKKEVSKSFIDFYSNLFSSQNPRGIDECLSYLDHRVSNDMNQFLLKPFTGEEVRNAMFQMNPLKSPGPDGFSAGFYQQSWGVVGEEVTKAVLEVLNGSLVDAGINATFICLIPKMTSPSKVSDFRPISLCNVIYKLIAKVIANRLKRVLPDLISKEQSAFIPGRIITNNVLVAFETLHTMDTRLKGKEGYMAVKLDMSKAYDRLEWSFVEGVLRKLGFANRWVVLLMSCIRSVTYSILINGQPQGLITPSRGIRQGDPLSPYLFILCAEALSSLIQNSAREGRISGVPLSRGGTRINHLLFADDSLLFCRANIRE